MPFTPLYESIYETLAVDNVMAVVLRDMKSCLDANYASANYPDFAQRTFGEFRMPDSFPFVMFDPASGGGDDSEQFTSPTFVIDIYLGVEDADRVEASRKLMKYVRCLVGVLKTAPISDFATGASHVFALDREYAWKYGVSSKNANRGTWMRPAQITLTLKYAER